MAKIMTFPEYYALHPEQEDIATSMKSEKIVKMWHRIQNNQVLPHEQSFFDRYTKNVSNKLESDYDLFIREQCCIVYRFVKNTYKPVRTVKLYAANIYFGEIDVPEGHNCITYLFPTCDFCFYALLAPHLIDGEPRRITQVESPI